MFSPMDATRTDEEYLLEVIEAVSDAGTDWINIPDTCGVATPTRFSGHDRRGLCPHRRAGQTCARTTISGWPPPTRWPVSRNGAAQAQVSVNSIGERAGNAAYEEYVMAIESLYQCDTGIDTTRITELSEIVEEKSGMATPGNKPVVGDNAFSHESGIHAAGVIETPTPSNPAS